MVKKFLFSGLIILLTFSVGCASRVYYLTSGWRYHLGDLEGFEKIEFDDSNWEEVAVPHSLRIEPYKFNFTQRYYRGAGLYRVHFTVFKDSFKAGDRILIHFEGALTKTQVWLNGKYIGEHLGGYTPFTFDITEEFLPGKDNLLSVRVDNSRMNVPPEGALVDYTLFGGIYREVWIERKNPVYMENPFAWTTKIDEKKAVLKITAQAKNFLPEPVSCQFETELIEEQKTQDQLNKITITRAEKEYVISPGENQLELELLVENPKLWSMDYPYLYQLKLYLSCPEARKESIKEFPSTEVKMVDSVSFPFGLRWLEFTNQGFFLNGKPVKLVGFNRHQTYPYIGNAGSFRLQYLDALLLKQTGANFVRLSHYPQSPDFLDACDRLGLLVFEELPGWGYVGNQEWKNIAEQALEEMILRDRNRPSIILWGVRINESWWGEKWLAKMVELGHRLDPTRPASGARFLRNFRQFSEDVIAHNDYSGKLLIPPTDKPWLVSEYSVGSSSTLPDKEQIKIIQRNAYFLDLILSEPTCSGSAGWAFADYNTFMNRLVTPDAKGRIRAHGLVDIFRVKKPIYYFYQAQNSTSPMIKIINRWWTKEDFPGEVMVVGNCQKVRLFLNGKELETKIPDKIYTYPKRGEYHSLSYPPFSFSGFNFEPGELSAECLVGNEIRAIDRLKTPGPDRKIQLELGEEYTELSEPSWLIPKDFYSDPIRLIARLTDGEGNLVKENQGKIKFSVSENAEIIGDNPFQLVDGIAVVLLKIGDYDSLISSLKPDNNLAEVKIRAEILSKNLNALITELSIFIPVITEAEEQKPELKTGRDAITQEELFGQPDLILKKLFLDKLIKRSFPD